MKAILTYLVILILAVASTSCEKEGDFIQEILVPEPETLVFVQMADTQIGMRDYKKELDNFHKAVDYINELKPDFVTICGDLVNTAGDEVYADFLEIKERLEVPIYLVAGNHDVLRTPTYNSLTYYRETIGSDYYSFDVKGYSFVVTNTQLWDAGPQDERDLHRRWFDWTMAVQEDGKSFVLGHYPLRDTEPDTEQYLLDKLDDKNSIAYLSGHAHRTIIDEYNGVLLVSARSVGYTFGDGVEGFRVWTVNKDSTEHKLIKL